MAWSRSGWAAAVLSLGACGSASQAQPTSYHLQEGQITRLGGPDGNTVILDAPDGLIVVDTGRHPEHAEAILRHADQAGKPIAAIVNTHWHLDHATGNRDLRQAHADAAVVATDAGRRALSGFIGDGVARATAMLADPSTPPEQRAVAARMLAAVEDGASFLPVEPVSGDGPIVLGGRTVQLRVAPAAVTEADLWLLVPEEKLAIVGDLVVGPAPFFDTGCEEGWVRALAAIAAARWDTLIPGHGKPMTRADFTRWRGAFHSYLDCARSEATAQACAAGWANDAKGFYTAEEGPSVRELMVYYTDRVLRAPPETRMGYCTP